MSDNRKLRLRFSFTPKTKDGKLKPTKVYHNDKWWGPSDVEKATNVSINTLKRKAHAKQVTLGEMMLKILEICLKHPLPSKR